MEMIAEEMLLREDPAHHFTVKGIFLATKRVLNELVYDTLEANIIHHRAVLDHLAHLHAPQVHLGVFRAPPPRPPTPPSPRPPPPAERHLRGQKRAPDPLLTLAAAPQSPTLMATKDPRPIVAICGVWSRRRARFRCLAYQRTDRAARYACGAAEVPGRFCNV